MYNITDGILHADLIERNFIMQTIIVTESSRNIRALARQALAGKWKTAILATLIYYVMLRLPVYILDWLFPAPAEVFGYDQMYNLIVEGTTAQEYLAQMGTTTVVGSIYLLLITGPLTLGYISFILSTFRRQEAPVGTVLYGFEYFVKALGLHVMISIFCFLWTLLLVVPGIIAWYRYRMAFYLLRDNPSIGVFEAINESKRLMRGNKSKLFCLDLSFIGWLILGAFFWGIGMIAVLPYYTSAEAAFYEMVTGHMQLRRPGEGGGYGGGPTDGGGGNYGGGSGGGYGSPGGGSGYGGPGGDPSTGGPSDSGYSEGDLNRHSFPEQPPRAPETPDLENRKPQIPEWESGKVEKPEWEK